MPLTKSTPTEVIINDFEKSDNPKFAGKSKEKRKEMAIAASYKVHEGYLAEDKWDDDMLKIAGENRKKQAHVKSFHNDEGVSAHVKSYPGKDWRGNDTTNYTVHKDVNGKHVSSTNMSDKDSALEHARHLVKTKAELKKESDDADKLKAENIAKSAAMHEVLKNTGGKKIKPEKGDTYHSYRHPALDKGNRIDVNDEEGTWAHLDKHDDVLADGKGHEDLKHYIKSGNAAQDFSESVEALTHAIMSEDKDAIQEAFKKAISEKITAKLNDIKSELFEATSNRIDHPDSPSDMKAFAKIHGISVTNHGTSSLNGDNSYSYSGNIRKLKTALTSLHGSTEEAKENHPNLFKESKSELFEATKFPINKYGFTAKIHHNKKYDADSAYTNHRDLGAWELHQYNAGGKLMKKEQHWTKEEATKAKHNFLNNKDQFGNDL